MFYTFGGPLRRLLSKFPRVFADENFQPVRGKFDFSVGRNSPRGPTYLRYFGLLSLLSQTTRKPIDKPRMDPK